jgi:hypothetical protein
MNIPDVASDACCRNTVELSVDVEARDGGRGICSMSIGIASRWHAKIAFMMGMYWCAKSVEGEAVTNRIRDWILLLSFAVRLAVGLLVDAPVRDSV